MTAQMRTLLGKSRTLGSRAEIYQVADGLEIDASEQYDVVQRRVLFDDVLMVTIHREIGPMYLVGTGAVALLFTVIAILIVSMEVDAWPFALAFAVFGVPALTSFLLRLFLGIDIITVFGRRSKTELRFPLRKQRAREVYGQICAAVRSAHRRMAVERTPSVAAIPSDAIPPFPESLNDDLESQR